MTENACSHESLMSLPCSGFPDTWVWVLQFLLESGESRAEGLWVLQKHLVHNQYCFLSDVGFSVGHLLLRKKNKRAETVFIKAITPLTAKI